MPIDVSAVGCEAIADYAHIPISFQVRTVFDVEEEAGSDEPGGLVRFKLSERRLARPYMKDYDVLGETPDQWPRHFDVSRWGLLLARSEQGLVGGAAVAFDTPELDMLEGRTDLAVLWDIRIVPAHRRHGVGSALFEAVETWARERGCRQLKVETQNNNVAACRFYARQGCVLRAANRGVYAELPDEIQLLWYKELWHAETPILDLSPDAKRSSPGRAPAD